MRARKRWRDTLRGVSAHSCLRNYYVKVQASNKGCSKEQQGGLQTDKAGGSEWHNVADYSSGAGVEGGKTSKQCSLWLHLKAKLSLTGWGRCELSMSAGRLWEGVQAAIVCPELFFRLSLQTFCGLWQKKNPKNLCFYTSSCRFGGHIDRQPLLIGIAVILHYSPFTCNP